MSSRPEEPRLPLSLGQRPGLSHDGRIELGYGTTNQSSSETDTISVDDHEDIDLELDDTTLLKISNKHATPYKSSDHLIGRSADHSSLANGNRPVAIGESLAVAAGLVPFPNMYKKRVQAGGGVNSPKTIAPGQYNRTGTYRGWSHAPIDLQADLSYDDEATEDDLALKKVRKLVRSVLKNNILET